MKSIDILHAHNHGHKNVGDDAMANNVFGKLSAITTNLSTISTYSPPQKAGPDKDVKSLSGTINTLGPSYWADLALHLQKLAHRSL